MAYIHKALKTTNDHIKYVPFLALGGLIVWTESTQLYSLFSVVLAFTLYPIVYGSIVEKGNDKSSSWIDLLSKHFGNYFLFTTITIIPIMALSYFYSDLDFVENTIIKAIVGAFTQIATVYMLPLVFISAHVLTSIPQGLSFLKNKGWGNIPLILLILLTAMIKVLATLSLIFVFQSKEIFLIYSIGYLQNLINVYIDLMVFSMATAMLLAENSGQSTVSTIDHKQ
jgi:hypothetical protein